MWRASDRVRRRGGWRAAWTGAIALTLLIGTGTVHAQNGEGRTPGGPAAASGPAEASAALDAYLDRPGLRTLLAEHLAARLKSAPPEQRPAIAERLGKLYVEFIASSKTAADRDAWEERARELIKLVPDVKSYELRLDLARTVYAKAEQAAERHRLRLATTDEAAEAERTLRQLKPQFESVAAEAGRRVDALERAEEGARAPESISEELAETRRARSIAAYYAGWAAYYLAFLSGSEQAAADALRNFGPVLGAMPGRSATIERLPRSLLKYDHVARAAIGCALASALRRHGDVEGLRWLDAIEAAPSPGVPPEVRGQILTRRLTILAGAGRWADVESLVRYARGGDHTSRPESIRPLDAAAARLLAVLCFEADRRHNAPTIEQLGQAALSDLVARSEVGQVLDLAQRYGTTPLGDTGFIVHYVRGMQALERAVMAQTDSGEDPEQPTTTDAIINQYRQAAALLDGSIVQLDAGKFPGERARALVAAGRALFRAGDLTAAADRFARAAGDAPDKAQAQDALWLAIVTLDRAARLPGASGVRARLDELIVLFVREYPGTERAANLLIRDTGGTGSGIDDEQTISVLLGVKPDSPLYLSARRQAARVLYARVFRRAPESARASAATRFMKIAEEVLAAEKQLAIESATGSADGREATERVVLLTRQMLDAILSLPAPDVARAEQALDTLRTVVAHHGADLSKHQAEFTFRRFQILLAKEDQEGAEKLAEELRAAGDRLADSADRVLFQRAVTRWRRAGGGSTTTGLRPEGAAADPWLKTHAAAVVRFGTRLIDAMGAGPGALKDPAVTSVYNQVAQAAADLWDTEKLESARDLAIRLDRAILEAAKADNAPPPVEVLTRLAVLAEAAGDSATAQENWRLLASGLRGGSTEWFRAKYNTARLLAASDAAKARELISQVEVLYPDLGPEPWRSRLRELIRRLQSAPPSTPASPPAPDAGGGGGGAP